MHFQLNSSQQRVSDSLCEELKKRPDDKEQCRISCPSDCVLSPWGAWSDCPDLCQEGRPQAKIRTRKRQIIAYSGTGQYWHQNNRQLLMTTIKTDNKMGLLLPGNLVRNTFDSYSFHCVKHTQLWINTNQKCLCILVATYWIFCILYYSWVYFP